MNKERNIQLMDQFVIEPKDATPASNQNNQMNEAL
jgi:hypothetical protein